MSLRKGIRAKCEKLSSQNLGFKLRILNLVELEEELNQLIKLIFHVALTQIILLFHMSQTGRLWFGFGVIIRCLTRIY